MTLASVDAISWLGLHGRPIRWGHPIPLDSASLTRPLRRCPRSKLVIIFAQIHSTARVLPDWNTASFCDPPSMIMQWYRRTRTRCNAPRQPHDAGRRAHSSHFYVHTLSCVRCHPRRCLRAQVGTAAFPGASRAAHSSARKQSWSQLPGRSVDACRSCSSYVSLWRRRDCTRSLPVAPVAAVRCRGRRRGGTRGEAAGTSAAAAA